MALEMTGEVPTGCGDRRMLHGLCRGESGILAWPFTTMFMDLMGVDDVLAAAWPSSRQSLLDGDAASVSVALSRIRSGAEETCNRKFI